MRFLVEKLDDGMAIIFLPLELVIAVLSEWIAHVFHRIKHIITHICSQPPYLLNSIKKYEIFSV